MYNNTIHIYLFLFYFLFVHIDFTSLISFLYFVATKSFVINGFANMKRNQKKKKQKTQSKHLILGKVQMIEKISTKKNFVY